MLRLYMPPQIIFPHRDMPSFNRVLASLVWTVKWCALWNYLSVDVSKVSAEVFSKLKGSVACADGAFEWPIMLLQMLSAGITLVTAMKGDDEDCILQLILLGKCVWTLRALKSICSRL